MADRDEILARVQRAARHRAPAPADYVPPTSESSWERFAASVAKAGGEAHGPYAPHALSVRVTSSS